MMSEAQLLASNALRSLRQTSEARGLTFYVHPPREIVPEFLGDFQPDALALGADGGIVIEVKNRQDPVSAQKLATIAKRVSNQRGWEFRAIYLPSSSDEFPSIAQPTPEQLQIQFDEIAALTNGGHLRAALVAAWTTLEALARLVLPTSEAGNARGIPAVQAIQILAQEGYIEHETADRLRALARLRNAVVHGDFSVEVRSDQIEALLSNIRSVAAEIMMVKSEQMPAR